MSITYYFYVAISGCPGFTKWFSRRIQSLWSPGNVMKQASKQPAAFSKTVISDSAVFDLPYDWCDRLLIPEFC